MTNSHGIETFEYRHYADVAEIWCPELDEEMTIFDSVYIRYCPMCGGVLNGE